MQAPTSAGPLAVIERIQAAVNAHDLHALGECFHHDYLSEQPAHPDRIFRGREQMRKNWAQIFAAVPDIRADVLRSAVDGSTVWTEWDMQGSGPSGAPWHNVMVTIADTEQDQVVWMRLFIELVGVGEGIDSAMRADLDAGSPSR